MLSFGERLKTLRRESGFSQSYIAEQIGVSIQSVSNWECDNTMPDISQIVPLASILGISTDCLLGVGKDQNGERKKLEENVKKIWAKYSVNTAENNADYMVYELYKDYLRKYPLDYDIKYLCALALNDYLTVSKNRNKFVIPKKEFDELYCECDRMLCSICDNDRNTQRKINAAELRIRHFLLCEKWSDAENLAEEMPEFCGIKENVMRMIYRQRGEKQKAADSAQSASKIKLRDYILSLYYRAKCISEKNETDKTDAVNAWKDMEYASKEFLRLYLNIDDFEVNNYENNPYCCLITSFTSRCADYLDISDTENALSCIEKATDIAIEMYNWVIQNCSDKLIIEDIKFFVSHTPSWCYRFCKHDNSKIAENERYKKCENRIAKTLGNK